MKRRERLERNQQSSCSSSIDGKNNEHQAATGLNYHIRPDRATTLSASVRFPKCTAELLYTHEHETCLEKTSRVFLSSFIPQTYAASAEG